MLVLEVDGRRSVLRDNEVEAEVVVSVLEVSIFPLSNSGFRTDESMFLLMTFIYFVSIFTLSFHVESSECNLFFSFERHVQS